ncbi:hypothetical protein [Microbacterium tumbae]
MSPPSPAIAFDAHPLTEPVDPRAVSAFVAEMRARRTTSVTAGAVIAIVAVVLAAVVLLPMMLMIGIGVATQGFPPAAILPFLLILATVVIGGAFGVAAWRRNRVKRYRLSRFAVANGMTYEDRIDAPGLPGMIFGIGSGRQSRELVRGHSPRFVEFGNYQYTVKSGKNSTTYRWGYVAVKLDVPLPNIVLDATGNNSVFGSNLPASFRKDQRLSLEGDFDRYFTLYCPEGYERDALYLFTPDIMARFVDNAAQLDVEIVDDWLFLYTQREASTLDPATWAWLFGAVGALIAKFDQWARWRDERLIAERGPDAAAPAPSSALPFAAPAGLLAPPPGVAREGRRLRRGTRWVPIVFMIVVGLFWFWSRWH